MFKVNIQLIVTEEQQLQGPDWQRQAPLYDN